MGGTRGTGGGTSRGIRRTGMGTSWGTGGRLLVLHSPPNSPLTNVMYVVSLDIRSPRVMLT